MSRNPIARQIDATFSVGKIWIVQKGHEADAELLKMAMDEIDRLQARVIEQDEAIAAEMADERQKLADARKKHGEKISEYAQLIDGTHADIKRVRNAAKSLVTQIDKTSFSEDETT